MRHQVPPERLDLPLLDVLRVLASVAIVRHHMREDCLFGVGFGLPLFLVILFALATSSRRPEPLGRFARRKVAYLLTPWVRWSLIYVVLLVSAEALRGRPPTARLHAAMLWTGGHGSLWFLPFAAVALLPAKALALAARRRGASGVVLAAALAGLAATTASPAVMDSGLPDVPWKLWLRFTPAIAWGLALGACLRARDEGERRRLLAVVALLALLGWFASPLQDHPEDLPRRFAVAVPLACLGLAWRPAIPAAVRGLGTATFGIYVTHPLVAKVLATALDPFAWSPTTHTAAVWCGSFALVIALRRLVPWHEFGRSGAPVSGGSDRGHDLRVARPGAPQELGHQAALALDHLPAADLDLELPPLRAGHDLDGDGDGLPDRGGVTRRPPGEASGLAVEDSDVHGGTR